MIDSIIRFLNKIKDKQKRNSNSKDTAKERLHLVLMQDRANVSADFLELMKMEIIEVIKKYIEVDESSIDVRLTNKENNDGTTGAPALYANIPIMNIKDEARCVSLEDDKKENNEAKKEEAQNDEVRQEENEKNKEEKQEEIKKEDNVIKEEKNEESEKSDKKAESKKTQSKASASKTKSKAKK